MWHAKRFLAVCRSILVLGVHTNFHLPKKPHEAVYMAFLVSRSTYHGINRQSFDMVAGNMVPLAQQRWQGPRVQHAWNSYSLIPI